MVKNVVKTGSQPILHLRPVGCASDAYSELYLKSKEGFT